MINAGLYIRVSTDAQASEGVSLEAQSSSLIKYCNKNEWKIAGEYRDVKSGSTKERTGFQQLLQDCEDGKISVVVVYRLDRFSRSLSDLIMTIDILKSLNVDFVSLSENIDTTSSVGKLMFHIIGAFAEFERDIIRERVMAGMLKNAQDGFVQNKPPFGYKFIDKKLVIEGDDSDAVRDMYNSYLNGDSVRKIADYYFMSKSRVHHILHNEIYCGRIQFGGITYDGNHERIISDELFNSVAQLLTRNRKK